MNVALDLGTSHIRSLRRESDRLISRGTRLVFSILPDSPSHRRLLDQAGLRFTMCDDGIVLLGDAAYDSSDLFKVPCRSLLVDGALPENDPLSRQLYGSLVEAILPASERQSDICCLTVPGGCDLSGNARRSDLEFFTRLVRLQGYEPHVVPASQALTLAELVSSAFTGISMIFGASGCEAMLAHRGEPVCHVRTEQGGDWLDAQLIRLFQKPLLAESVEAGLNPADLPRHIQHRREQISNSLVRATDDFERATARLTTGVIEELLSSLSAELKRTPRAVDVPQPIALICAGGLSRAAGFDSLLARSLDRESLPLEIQQPRIVAESTHSIGCGLLIIAELEAAERQQSRRVA